MSDVTLTAVGDIMLGRSVDGVIKEKGADFPFLNVKGSLSGSDIIFGVLDSPIVVNGTPNPDKPKGFPVLRCSPHAVEGLRNARFDVMHIGTNHVLDFGKEGLEDTIKYVSGCGIGHIGAGRDLEEARRPVILERNGIRIGFLGYCLSYPADKNQPGCAPLRFDIIKEDVSRLRSRVDHVVVSIHHGIEYSFYPYPEYIDLAHQIIDRGASVILGHHPHALQGYERYKDGFIIYSLGNFVFDKDDKTEERASVSKIRLSLEEDGIIARPQGPTFYESVILKICFDKAGIKKFTFIPIIINDAFQPAPAEGAAKERILSHFEEISAGLKGRGAAFFYELSKLYAEENIEVFFKKNIWEAVLRFYKIRPRHVRQLVIYLTTKISDLFSWRKGNVRKTL